MKEPVCPFCGWEIDHPDYEDALSYCRHCSEWVVAEEQETLERDPDLEAEIVDDLLTDELQDEYESDAYNYGVDDEQHGGRLDGEII